MIDHLAEFLTLWVFFVLAFAATYAALTFEP
jgi:hypothetical protein